VTPIVAVEDLVASALLVAVTVICPGEFGAVKVAVVAACELKVPLGADQTTPAPPTSFVTVAVKFNDCPSTNPPRFGVSVKLIGGVTVIAAATDFVVSVTEVAVSVTVAGVGTLVGAV
jgi:hypothetical protein